MKVLHIITGLDHGGAENTLYNLLKNSINIDQKVLCLSKKRSKYSILIENLGIDIVYLDFEFSITFILRTVNLIFKKKKFKPTVFHCWMYHTFIVSIFLSIFYNKSKIYWSVRHSNIKNDIKFTTRLIIYISSIFSYIVPYKIIYVAFSSKNNHEKIGYDKKKAIVIHNGIDTTYYSYDPIMAHEFLKKNNINNNQIKIICLARFDRQKDHKNLFMAIKDLSLKFTQFKLILVGLGMDQDNIELNLLINENQINEYVTLIGPLDNVVGALSASDILVSSSSGEAFPNVIAEAMLTHNLCVATDVGDTKFIIKNHGWIVPSKNFLLLSDSIFEAITFLQNSDNDRLSKKFDDSSTHIKNNFSIQEMTNKHIQLWANC